MPEPLDRSSRRRLPFFFAWYVSHQKTVDEGKDKVAGIFRASSLLHFGGQGPIAARRLRRPTETAFTRRAYEERTLA